MNEMSARHALPLIAPGQAQKELTHNEALALIDLLLQPVVVAMTDTPPGAPVVGQSWIVGTAPTGAWAGHAGALAGWTTGGWRFAAPVAGMRVEVAGGTAMLWHDAGGWQSAPLRGTILEIAGTKVVGARAAAIADPTGGTTIDAEVRTAVGTILTALRGHGLIGS